MLPSVFIFLLQLYKQLETSAIHTQKEIVLHPLPPPTTLLNSHPTPTLPFPSQTPLLTPTVIPSIVQGTLQIPSSTPKPTIIPTPVPTTLPTPIPSTTSVPNALLLEVNQFRKEYNKQHLTEHSVLCGIATERLNSLQERTTLDNHEGFQQYTEQLKQSFSFWGEVIHYSEPPKTPSGIVFEGWAHSEGHKQTVLSDEAFYGCGAYGGGFAVFLVSKGK